MRSLFRRKKPKRRGSGEGTVPGSAPPSPFSIPRHPRQLINPPSQQSTEHLEEEDNDLWYRKPTSRTEIDEAGSEELSHPYDLEHPLPMEPGGSINSARSPKPHPKPRVIRHSGAYPVQQPKKETKITKKNQKAENNHGSYKSLLPYLLNGDWGKASALLDAHPEIARQAEEVHLHGQLTVALPLHIASCLHIPIGLFDMLLKTHPQATQQPDDACGRLPLHWACRSSASVHVLDKLIQTFPTACKAYDRAEDRTPLHYVAVHATSMDQISILLRAPVNQKRILKHNDAARKTPLELAKMSKSPIKEDIVNTLLHQLEILSHNKNQGGTDDTSLSDLPMAVQNRSDATVQSMPAPRSTRYDTAGLSPRQQTRRGIYPSLGAQAAAFTGEGIPESSPSSKSKGPPQYRFRGSVRPIEDGAYKPSAPPLAAAGDPSSGERRTTELTRSAPDMASPSTRQELVNEKQAPRSQPKMLSPPLQRSSAEVDEYYSKYMKKMSAEQKLSHGKDEQQDHGKHDSDRSSISGQSLMNEMKSNMDRLEESMSHLRADLLEKESHLANLEATTAEMELHEQDLERGLRNARSLVEHQHKELDQKRERIASLKDRIAVLRAELLEEQSTLEPVERTIMGLEQKIVDKEQKLQAHREEKDSFELMKQSLLEEKQFINRELENSNSELKSLKAIQDLAMGKEDSL